LEHFKQVSKKHRAHRVSYSWSLQRVAETSERTFSGIKKKNKEETVPLIAIDILVNKEKWDKLF